MRVMLPLGRGNGVGVNVIVGVAVRVGVKVSVGVRVGVEEKTGERVKVAARRKSVGDATSVCVRVGVGVGTNGVHPITMAVLRIVRRIQTRRIVESIIQRISQFFLAQELERARAHFARNLV